jgi:hypothetical protein
LQACPCSEYHLDHLLRSLPHALDETYERILCSIDNNSTEETRRILTILCYSPRPLTVSELIDAIAVEIKDSEGLDRKRRLQDAVDIQRICSGLIEIDLESYFIFSWKLIQTVRIAHFSIQEYLESERIGQQKASMFCLNSVKAHGEIAEVCLLYLLKPALSSTPLSRTTLQEYPLADFAAEYWFYHYQHAKRPAS